MGNAYGSRHFSWNDFTEQEIYDIWAYKTLCGGGFKNAMICTVCTKNPHSKCLSRNSDSCDCAKERFLLQERPLDIHKLNATELETLKKKIAVIEEEKAYLRLCK